MTRYMAYIWCTRHLRVTHDVWHDMMCDITHICVTWQRSCETRECANRNISHVTHIWVMPHMRICDVYVGRYTRHVTHIQVMPHRWICYVYVGRYISHVTHIWVMSHMCICYVTYGSDVTYLYHIHIEWNPRNWILNIWIEVMSHMCICYVTYMSDVTNICMWMRHVAHDSYTVEIGQGLWARGVMSYMRCDTFIYVTWLVYVWCDMYVCDMTCTERIGQSLRARWVMQQCNICDVTYSYMWRDTFIYVPWLVYVWRDTYTCDMTCIIQRIDQGLRARGVMQQDYASSRSITHTITNSILTLPRTEGIGQGLRVRGIMQQDYASSHFIITLFHELYPHSFTNRGNRPRSQGERGHAGGLCILTLHHHTLSRTLSSLFHEPRE